MMQIWNNHELLFKERGFVMKKDFGRFLILVCGFGLFMLMGAAFEGLMSFGGIFCGVALCLGGGWACVRFLLREAPRAHRKAIRLDFSGSPGCLMPFGP